MKFDYLGYELKFIQKQPSKDKSSHLYSLIYKFFSPISNYHYILTADYHKEDVFAIKFYCKKDRHSDYKYSKIVNKGDVGNILMTCAKAVPLIFKDYPTASFGFSGARSIDFKSLKVEDYRNNQRFRIYKKLVAIKFGTQTFTHYEYEAISAYLLVNNKCKNIKQKERDIAHMFSATYINLPDL